MDGAAQRFSGEIQTANFDYADLEELFYNLEWHLCSKNVINSFYESYGFAIPYPLSTNKGPRSSGPCPVNGNDEANAMDRQQQPSTYASGRKPPPSICSYSKTIGLPP